MLVLRVEFFFTIEAFFFCSLHFESWTLFITQIVTGELWCLVGRWCRTGTCPWFWRSPYLIQRSTLVCSGSVFHIFCLVSIHQSSGTRRCKPCFGTRGRCYHSWWFEKMAQRWGSSQRRIKYTIRAPLFSNSSSTRSVVIWRPFNYIIKISTCLHPSLNDIVTVFLHSGGST